MMKTVIALFTKNPKKGKVKTRLGETIGMENSCKLAKAFLKDLITEHSGRSYELKIFTPTTFPIQKYTKKNIGVHKQKGENLGEKMFNAFKQLHKHYEKVIIIGSDMPHLPTKIIKKAIKHLENKDVVLGPTEDGGYYLIGMKEANNIFEKVHWSTKTVLQETIKNIKKKKLTYALLSKSYDIDTIKELRKFIREFKNKTAPHTKETIKKYNLFKL